MAPSFQRLPIAALLAGWVFACAGTPPPVTRAPVLPARESEILVDPARNCGTNPQAPDSEELTRATARLVAGVGPAELLEQASDLAARSAGGRLLLSQVEYRMGRPAALRRLQELVLSERACTGAWLLLGAVLEEQGEVVEAALAYQEARALPPAAARLGVLRDRASAELARRIDEELQRGHPERAEEWLSKLKGLEGGASGTLMMEMEVARKLADDPRELTSLRLLAPPAADAELRERWAELEMLVGIPAQAVHLAEELAQAAPREASRADFLDEMRFRYRLTLLPEAVQEALALPALERADLAALLYWLAPGIRQTRVAAREIASDVVGHRWREEIVRCVNLDLLSLDPALRSFHPQRAATRSEALSALLKAQSRYGTGSCGERHAVGVEREAWCAFAVNCALLDSAEECLPGLPVTGQEIAIWLRKLARIASLAASRP